jgi:lysylphosphatidylglycerol synthetase-like protein (DUF2156 family)
MRLNQVTAFAFTIAKRLGQAWMAVLLLVLGGNIVAGKSYQTLDMLNAFLLSLAVLACITFAVLRLVLSFKNRKARRRGSAESSAAHSGDEVGKPVA